MNIENLLTPYLIPHAISLFSAYIIAAISLFTGKRTKERILLSLTCIMWTMLSWAFILHPLIIDFKVLLSIESFIHSIVVFVPSITLYLFQEICDSHNKKITYISFATSTLLSILAHTDYYFYGFNAYKWGIIAKPGPAFYTFVIFTALITVYTYTIFYKKLKTEKNPVVILKLKYFFLSFLLSAILSFFNIPSTMGVGLYPLGAFIFIPLWILSYGIFQPKVREVHWFINQFLISAVIIFLFLFPNMTILYFMIPELKSIGYFQMAATLSLWFVINYFYITRTQNFIEVFFRKGSRRLETIEKKFIKEISYLKNLNELLKNVQETIVKAIPVDYVKVIIRTSSECLFSDLSGNKYNLDSSINSILKNSDSYIERSFLLALKSKSEQSELLQYMDSHDYEYLVPLSHNGRLISIISLPRKINGKRLSDREVKFIHIISTYATIAIANSMIYQKLSDMKDNLETMVKERTKIINKQKDELENEIQLARRFQTTLLPQNIPSINNVDIAYRYIPHKGVGGDLIGIHHRKQMNEIGLFICDVSGHGITAALVGSMVKMSLNSWGFHIHNPGDALTAMRKKLSGKIGNNFITACTCTIELNSGEMVYANAGHPPMMIASKNGMIQKVNAKGKMITDYIISEYEERVHSLNPGDKIIMYTDGVTEVYNSKGEMADEKMLIEIIKRNLDLSPQKLCDRIYEDLMDFSAHDNSLDDDFAILIAEYKG